MVARSPDLINDKTAIVGIGQTAFGKGVAATELSLAGPLQAVAEPVAELVTYPIETVAKSEKGFDRTRQGESLTFLWPASQGSAQLIISPVS